MGAASRPAVSYLVSFSYLLLYGLMQVREGNTQHGSVTLDVLGAVPLLTIGRIVEYEVRPRRRERHRRDARAWHGGQPEDHDASRLRPRRYVGYPSKTRLRSWANGPEASSRELRPFLLPYSPNFREEVFSETRIRLA